MIMYERLRAVSQALSWHRSLIEFVRSDAVFGQFEDQLDSWEKNLEEPPIFAFGQIALVSTRGYLGGSLSSLMLHPQKDPTAGEVKSDLPSVTTAKLKG